MQTKTAKTRKKARLGARIFKLLEAHLLELRRLESKEAFEELGAEIAALKDRISDLEARQAIEGKDFLESPKFRAATKRRLDRAKDGKQRQKKEQLRQVYATRGKFRKASLYALRKEGLLKTLKQ